jgi:hypothetical protein
MGDYRQFITLDEAEQSIHKFYRLWQFGFRIMTDLGLDFFYQIKSVKLPVNPNYTVNLPSDFLNYSKVGVLNSRGEIIPLKYNDKLTTYAQFSQDRVQKTQDNTLFDYYRSNFPVWYNYWDGNVFTNIYGIPSGAPFIGSFKIDNSTGIILLDESFSYEYVMLEYVSSPKEGEPYYVPIQFKEAIIAGLAWYDIRSIPSKTHVNNSNVMMRRREFYNQRRLGWARYRPFNLMEAYEWTQTNQRLAVKI